MAKFCTKCGSQVADEQRFCNACGQPMGGPAPAAAPAAPGSTLPPPARSGMSPALKVVLIVVGVFAVLAALGVAGLVYTGFLIKDKVETAAKENGINLSDLASDSVPVRVDPCALLTVEELAGILDSSVMRSEREGNKCAYYGAAVSEEDRKKAMADALERAKQHSQQGESAGSANEKFRAAGMEEIAKKFGSAFNDGSAPIVTVELDGNGKAKMTAMKIAMKAMGGKEFSESLEGIGDEAILGPADSILVFLKDGVAVEIDLRQVANGRERGAEMARLIARRM